MYPFDIQRHITAVAYGEHTAVNNVEVLRRAIGRIHNHAVGHTDIIRTGLRQTLCNSLMDLITVHFITDIEEVIHISCDRGRLDVGTTWLGAVEVLDKNAGTKQKDKMP